MAKKRKKGGLVFIGNKWGPRRAKPRSVKPRARARIAKPGDTGPGPLAKSGDAAAGSPEAARGAPTVERS
jgi:hypothetical protein